ncbi:hypothetical protein CEXT_130641 [Caerostris extrusa]|uniref:Uncharacterized protein n=1 Tax=Caerostris extrusa TaxID=172846 RepID=A0AAV4XJY3_CAEEX|nr:hypothetical protein CEXT_130641 [Caerostris extrusa]
MIQGRVGAVFQFCFVPHLGSRGLLKLMSVLTTARPTPLRGPNDRPTIRNCRGCRRTMESIRFLGGLAKNLSVSVIPTKVGVNKASSHFSPIVIFVSISEKFSSTV